MDKIKEFSMPVKFGKIEKFSSQFSKCNVSIAYANKNRNNTNISKEVFKSMIPSLYGCPIIGEWDETDFKSHGGKIEITDSGVTYSDTTKPYGYIDSQSKVWWENITEEDGSINEYLFTECFLWTGRYPEAEKVLDGKNNQSMEILIDDMNYGEDGYLDILSAQFSALCILGESVEPAFESARISQFNLSKDEFKAEFNLMVKELKESFKGGENVTKKFEEEITEEIVEDFVKTEETIETEKIIEPEETVEEIQEETEEVAEVADKEIEEKVNEIEVEKFTKTFELSHDDVRSKLYNQLYKVEETDNTWYWIDRVFDDHFIYSNDIKIFKQGYIKTDVDVALEGERVEMFVEYLTEGELTTLNNMRGNYELTISENTELKSFKENILLQQKSNEFEEMFNKYSTLLDKSDFEDLKDSAMDMEIDALEKELSYRLVQKKFDFSKIVKKDSTKLSIKDDETNDEPYGSVSFNK